MTESGREPEITRRYRELAREEPPRALDEAILAAARREVETRPAPLVAPTARRSWSVPLAAAAVIVLSLVVTLQMQREQPDAELSAPPPLPPVSQKDSAPAASRPDAAPRAEAPREAAVEKQAPARAKVQARPAAPEPQPAPALVQRRASAPEPASAVGPQPSAAAVPPSHPEKPFPGVAGAAGTAAAPVGRAVPVPEESRELRQAVERDRPGRVAADAVSKRVEETETPERWLERIATLRREGRHKEADEAYAEFKRRYPEYRIPESMRERILPR